MYPLYVQLQMECSLPKVLQKCSLAQLRILYSLWNRTNCINLEENQQGVVREAKYKPCIFVFQATSQKLYRGFATWFAILSVNFVGKFEKYIKIIQKNFFRTS